MLKILINEVIQRDQTSGYLCLPSAIANPQDQRNTPHTPLLLVYIMRHSPGCLELPILGLQPTKTTMPGIIFNDSVQSLARLSGVMQSLSRSLPTRDNHSVLPQVSCQVHLAGGLRRGSAMRLGDTVL